MADGDWYVEGTTLTYNMTNAQIKKAYPFVQKKANQIVAKAKKKKTRKQRITVVNNELGKLITHNNKRKHCGNAYGALIEKKASCEGYSESFKLCMDKLGIPCDYARGTGKNGGFHVWNVVTLNTTKYKYVKKAYKEGEEYEPSKNVDLSFKYKSIDDNLKAKVYHTDENFNTESLS